MRKIMIGCDRLHYGCRVRSWLPRALLFAFIPSSISRRSFCFQYHLPVINLGSKPSTPSYSASDIIQVMIQWLTCNHTTWSRYVYTSSLLGRGFSSAQGSYILIRAKTGLKLISNMIWNSQIVNISTS